MNQHCAVSCCQRTNIDLFKSPNNPSALKRWQEILAVSEDVFQVCSLHFEDHLIQMRKVLIKDAVPSSPTIEIEKDINCNCCCKQISDPVMKIRVDEHLKILILNLLEFEVS